MAKELIFISSVQKEFANERQRLAAYLREDELLKSFFEPYLFEEAAELVTRLAAFICKKSKTVSFI